MSGLGVVDSTTNESFEAHQGFFWILFDPVWCDFFERMMETNQLCAVPSSNKTGTPGTTCFILVRF